MIKLIARIRRLEALTHDEFRAYYETSHRHLVGHFAHCVKDYRRNYPRPDLAAITGLYAAADDENDDAFDVLTELWFEDVDSLSRAFAILGSPEVRGIFEADERRFMDISSVRVTICDEMGNEEELQTARRSKPGGDQSFPIEMLTSPS